MTVYSYNNAPYLIQNGIATQLPSWDEARKLYGTAFTPLSNEQWGTLVKGTSAYNGPPTSATGTGPSTSSAASLLTGSPASGPLAVIPMWMLLTGAFVAYKAFAK